MTIVADHGGRPDLQRGPAPPRRAGQHPALHRPARPFDRRRPLGRYDPGDRSRSRRRPARIEVNSERLGLAGNWNRCVALSRTPLVAIFHQDDVMLPRPPGQVHLTAHSQNPAFGWVASGGRRDRSSGPTRPRFDRRARWSGHAGPRPGRRGGSRGPRHRQPPPLLGGDDQPLGACRGRRVRPRLSLCGRLGLLDPGGQLPAGRLASPHHGGDPLAPRERNPPLRHGSGRPRRDRSVAGLDRSAPGYLYAILSRVAPRGGSSPGAGVSQPGSRRLQARQSPPGPPSAGSDRSGLAPARMLATLAGDPRLVAQMGAACLTLGGRQLADRAKN